MASQVYAVDSLGNMVICLIKKQEKKRDQDVALKGFRRHTKNWIRRKAPILYTIIQNLA